MVRRRRGLVLLGSAAAIALILATIGLSYPWPERVPAYRPETVPYVTLSELGWDLVVDGDFDERRVEPAGDRIRFRALSGKTRRDTSKFLGARRREEVRLTPGARVTVELDWNRPANSSGLSAGFILAPEITASNPLTLQSVVWIEYIGVGPGRTARRMIGMREEGRHHHLDSEGWPQRPAGREINVQKFDLEVLDDGVLRVFENGALIYTSVPKTLRFDRGYLYLMLATRNTAVPREVFFGKINVTPGR